MLKKLVPGSKKRLRTAVLEQRKGFVKQKMKTLIYCKIDSTLRFFGEENNVFCEKRSENILINILG
jgi:hypothetical protein